MDKVEWRPVASNLSTTQQGDFPFYPANSPWVMVLDSVSNVTLKIEAVGTWRVSENPAVECSADGTPTIPNGDCVTPDALAGTLLAKFGGGSGEMKPKAITLVGASCVIVAAENAGPLFLAMNVSNARQPCFLRPPIASPQSLRITIFEAKV